MTRPAIKSPEASVTSGLLAGFFAANLVVMLVGLVSLALAQYAYLAFTDIRRME